MLSAVLSIRELTQQLHALGVTPGGVLLVHCAFSRVKPIEHGPEGLIAALQTVLGPAGTLVMPSMTDSDDEPFDPRTTPCRHLGVVANTFWQLPDVLRSNNPHAFAACGPDAKVITAPSPLEVPHGLDSPVGRVYERDGHVLLLGVGHDDNTTIHLAESLGGAQYRRAKHVTVLRDGQPTRIDYREIDHCCQRFRLVDGWLEAEHLQRRGQVGHAEARLIRSRDTIRVVLDQLRLDETVFLHPIGTDEECDEARASLRSCCHEQPRGERGSNSGAQRYE
jgi:aminoglycoside 3-N-acetyltransferase